MSILNIILIAVTLSLDAMAVSAANSARYPRMSFLRACRVAFFFGLFQALMPIIGWMMGTGLEKIASTFGPWIAFILLVILGSKMILESQKPKGEKEVDLDNWKVLILLSFATSVDALVVGVSLALVSVNIWLGSSLIGLITFGLCLSSVYVGINIGRRWGKHAELIGGIILIAIGVKILLEFLIK
ncbi:MAG: hypothetical protein A3J93_04195 [Candidatus Magasanikbacteria bacterium RIFOXYC2_FULL_42_28]|uniref:Putative manganese efflux pump MntP n=1 Tax=Candidatus Magasanikbacteria bacterium RIFOXYC2_FULL_42_28 TaxID=1798704 RepID=A0A1F6NWY6_9BACT|nr:MAG: hypothetical protein A3J93_04195 [Candidatus Magasanikbacteria bacterium RIFOXYC2_FULL_42_28]